jgi:hypothetical protein
MLAEQFTAAAAAARNTHAIDELARLTWRAHAENKLDDVEAEAIGEALQARRTTFSQGRGHPPARPPERRLRAARTPRAPDRQASLERRRRQALSGIVPARIAASFTMSELAVLTVVARQCQRAGTCTLHIDAIAALAGVCRRTVQTAMRHARIMGLVLVKERRIPGRKSLTNIVSINCPMWAGWIGRKNSHATHTKVFNSASSRPSSAEQRGLAMRKPAKIMPPWGGAGRGRRQCETP